MSAIAFLPSQQITFRAQKEQLDLANRIVTLIASDETPVERFSWERWEPYELTLSHDENHVDLERVKNGVAMFFDGHPGSFFSNSKRIGKIIEASIQNKRLICKVKLNRSPEGERYLQDVEDSTEPGNSVGIQLKKLELISKAKYEDSESNDEGYSKKKLKQPAKYRATSWSLQELSAVDIPAIPSARKLSKDEQEKFNALPKFPVEILGDVEAAEFFNVQETQSFEIGDKSMSEPKEISNEKSTQLADENRDLKLRLAAAEKEKEAFSEKLNKATLETQYLSLRHEALKLWAVDNKLTQEEYQLDFTDDLAADLQRLTSMSPDDARIELKTIDRSLRRASLKSPIERVNETDKALLSNDTIKSKVAEDPKKAEKLDNVQLSEKERQEKEADEFLKTLKIKRI